MNLKNIKSADALVYALLMYSFSAAISITLAEIFFLCALAVFLYISFKKGGPGFAAFTGPVALPLAVFALAHLAAAFFGVDMQNSLRDFRKIYIVLIFFAAYRGLSGERDLKKAAIAMMLGADVVGLYAGVNTVIYRFIKGDIFFRAESFSGDPMHAGGMLMMALIVAAAVLIYSVKAAKKDVRLIVFSAVSCLITGSGLLFTMTRGSWFSAFIGLLILALMLDRRAAVALILIAAASMFILRDTWFMQRVIRTFTLYKADSGVERMYMWESGMKIIKDYPLTGIGTGNLGKVYDKYRDVRAAEKEQGHLHNNIIQVAVIDGVTGLLAFIWLFTALFSAAIRAFTSAPDPALRAAAAAGVSVITGFFVNGMFEYNLFSSQVALMFWFIAGAALAGSHGSTENSKLQTPNSKPGNKLL